VRWLLLLQENIVLSIRILMGLCLFIPGVDGGELIRSSSRDSLNSVNHAPANHTPHMAREGSLGGAGLAAAQSNGIADK
jgi:hypothetical protein